MTATLRWGVGTHRGNVRECNEDATLGGPVVFAVADGMGGHACGDIASATAIRRLAEATDGNDLSIEQVLGAVDAANQAVLDASMTHPNCAGMGTTLAGLAVLSGSDRPSVIVFNVGDSRVYRRSGTVVEQISADHSVVADLVRAGEIDESAARHHPARNVVTRALGLAADVDADWWSIDTSEGDRFLICSDGLVNELAGDELRDAMNSELPPQHVIDELIERVLDGPAADNLSIVLVEIAGQIRTDESVEVTQPRSVVAPVRPLDEPT